MEIGFTGTQLGMTVQQKDRVRLLLEKLDPTGVAHGDCIGADAEFHNICLQLGKWIRIHPPYKGTKRAYCKEWNEILPGKDYLVRNRDIVAGVDCLIACPAEYDEQLRSGTWATVRYARERGIPIYVIQPDGSIRVE